MKGIGLGTQLGNDERYSLRHQARDEMHVAGKSIELGYHDRGFRLPGLSQSFAQPRPPLESVTSLARLDLDMLGDDRQALCFEVQKVQTQTPGGGGTVIPLQPRWACG